MDDLCWSLELIWHQWPQKLGSREKKHQPMRIHKLGPKIHPVAFHSVHENYALKSVVFYFSKEWKYPLN